jgi:hypothetical protein
VEQKHPPRLTLNGIAKQSTAVYNRTRYSAHLQRSERERWRFVLTSQPRRDQ